MSTFLREERDDPEQAMEAIVEQPPVMAPPPAIPILLRTDKDRFYHFLFATQDVNNDASMIAPEIQRLIFDFIRLTWKQTRLEHWQGTVANTWKCSTCSIYNSDNIRTCAACEIPRPEEEA